MVAIKAKEMKIDIKELKEFKRKNAEERLRFIDYWADYMKKHPDKVWSKAQNIVIDSQIN
jgi:hypothetical protein